MQVIEYITISILFSLLQLGNSFVSAQKILAFNNKSEVIQELRTGNINQNASYYTVGEGKEVMEMWSPFGPTSGGDNIAGVLLEAMQQHVRETRLQNNDTIRWILRIVGFERVSKDQLCTAGNTTSTEGCPDIVILGTLQVNARNSKGDLEDLSTYFQEFFDEEGIQLTDDFTKFTYNDYLIGNKWAAVPFVSDLRILFYNKTTFRNLGLQAPPPTGNWGTPYWQNWSWRQFANYSSIITSATRQPGFAFAGSFDEETKLLTSIMRNYGAYTMELQETGEKTNNSVENPLYKCGIQASQGMDRALDEVVRKIFVQDKSVSDFLINNDTAFQEYLKSPPGTTDKPLNSRENIPFPLIGMAYAFSGYSDEFMLNRNDTEIGVGFVPGQSTFLGGSGFGLTKKGKNKKLAWSLIKLIVKPSSNYLTKAGIAQRSPPPYDSIVQFREPWIQPEWSVHRAMLSRAMNILYPVIRTTRPIEIETVRPYRYMLADIMYKNVDNEVAKENFCSSIQNVIAPPCTLDDMTAVVGDCSANQTRTLTYIYKTPQNCFGGMSLPDPVTNITCSYVHVQSAHAISSITLVSIGIATAFIFIILMIINKANPTIKRTSPKFNVAILSGAVLIYSSVYLWIGKPNNIMCVGRVWAISLGFGIFLGGLLLKLWRVHRVFNAKRLASIKLNDFALFRILAVIIMMEICCLLFYTFYEPAMAVLKEKQVPFSSSFVFLEDKCADPNIITTTVLFSFNFTLLLFTIYISWAIRSIPKQFHEDKFVAMTVYAASLTILIAGPTLLAVKNTSAETSFLIYSLAIFFSVLFSTMILCVPKIMKVYSGDSGDDEYSSYSHGSRKRSESGLCMKCQQPLLQSPVSPTTPNSATPLNPPPKGNVAVRRVVQALQQETISHSQSLFSYYDPEKLNQKDTRK